jgi:hypothetical protein
MNPTLSRTSRLAVFLAASLTIGAPRLAMAQQEHSAADVAQGREVFNTAFKLREKGDLKGALEQFKAAHALVGSPLTGLELARAYIALGKLVEARETLLTVGRIPTRAEETANSANARKDSAQLASQLASRIPRLTVGCGSI